MKDYMNEVERERYGLFIVLIKVAEELLKSSVFSKEEKTNLKKTITWARKVNLLQEGRLSKSAHKTLMNTLNNGKVAYMDKYSADLWDKRKIASIKAGYDENKEYFNLVELICHYNCRGCTCTEYQKCGFYNEFELQGIPEFDGCQAAGLCKYSYKELK